MFLGALISLSKENATVDGTERERWASKSSYRCPPRNCCLELYSSVNSTESLLGVHIYSCVFSLSSDNIHFKNVIDFL